MLSFRLYEQNLEQMFFIQLAASKAYWGGPSQVCVSQAELEGTRLRPHLQGEEEGNKPVRENRIKDFFPLDSFVNTLLYSANSVGTTHWCAGRLSLQKMKKALICSLCWCLCYKYSHQGWLEVESGRDVHHHRLTGTSVLCTGQLSLLAVESLCPCVRILCAKERCLFFFFLSLGHCFSPIPECAIRNGAIFLKSLEMNRPSWLHLTCTTRWHFKDITGNWLYCIYFLTFYWSI